MKTIEVSDSTYMGLESTQQSLSKALRKQGVVGSTFELPMPWIIDMLMFSFRQQKQTEHNVPTELGTHVEGAIALDAIALVEYDQKWTARWGSFKGKGTEAEEAVLHMLAKRLLDMDELIPMVTIWELDNLADKLRQHNEDHGSESRLGNMDRWIWELNHLAWRIQCQNDECDDLSDGDRQWNCELISRLEELAEIFRQKHLEQKHSNISTEFEEIARTLEQKHSNISTE